MMRIFLSLLLAFVITVPAHAVRIKDLASLDGVRGNQLVGYGLVVGLDGSGDSSSSDLTTQSVVNMLDRLGMKVDQGSVKTDNVAAVMLTAELPPFAKAGSTFDVQISSIGDAESLAGGTLLMTPLKGPDGKTYGVAQGALLVGAYSVGGQGASAKKNHPTVGRIPGGATVEREVPFALAPERELRYRMRDSDFTTVQRTVAAIDRALGAGSARAVDGGSFAVRVPDRYQSDLVPFLASLEGIEVEPDIEARIVVNEKTGTIVMGAEVRIDTVAVSHGNLSLTIKETQDVSQPAPFSQGETTTTTDTSLTMTEDGGELMVVSPGVSIRELTDALNAIGASPRDMISILQAIEAAGALHARLVIM
jgi:flagellar P-ring protein precursor FlgI